ncbi:acetyltransferase [Alicyclobacillus cellulosilyticus]|uniref:Acetyltransferase n=1 Tax=Alicyclobacillus cellulosilyticus TaxID=1003997 RepID=A0A917KGA6_9BACL|nr:GNAT family N-acetyltransferase [Alicyclobacillus cellulosilyticus]GGJ11246.1 acetyltransferase [Alicyclobacillus cellulosilyticus]
MSEIMSEFESGRAEHGAREQIRTLRPEDVDQHLALSQFAFQYELSPEELAERRARIRPEDVLACYVDGQLAAQLTILPLTVYLAGQTFATGGIAGVATWPEHRRGGKVARLLRTALVRMRDAGQSVSMLAPFSFAFYRRYGWEHCIDRKQYTIDRALWPPVSRPAGRFVRTERWQDVAPVYEAFARRYAGMLSRSDEWWETRVRTQKPGIIAVYYDERGEARGYLIYRVRQQEMTIHEWVALDDTARQALWYFVRQHDSMAAKATLVAPVDDPLPFLLPEPRIEQQVIPYFMARIVDVAAMLRQYPFPPMNVPLHVRITDPDAPWNEGLFTVHPGVEDPARRVTHTPVAADDAAAVPEDHIACDIQAFTAMMFGYLRPGQLAAAGRIGGSPAALMNWDQAVLRQTPFLYDFF